MFKVGPIMYISLANEGKIQVGWVNVVGRKVWWWANVNNIPPKGSFYHVLNLDEMIVRSSCLEVSEKYSGDGRA
jgi:hypothetical protein